MRNPFANRYSGETLEFFNGVPARNSTLSARNDVKISAFAVSVLWLGWPALAPAQPDAAMLAWQAGDSAAAREAWQERAEQGDAEASLYLGYIHRNGVSVPRNEALALHWYRRAAEMGQAEAQYELGLMYELGIGVAADPREAAMWYGLSSAQACPGQLSAGGRLGDR